MSAQTRDDFSSDQTSAEERCCLDGFVNFYDKLSKVDISKSYHSESYNPVIRA